VTLIGRNNDTKPTADNTGNEGSNDVLDGTINRQYSPFYTLCLKKRPAFGLL